MGLSPSRVQAVVGPAVVDYLLGLASGGPHRSRVTSVAGLPSLHGRHNALGETTGIVPTECSGEQQLQAGTCVNAEHAAKRIDSAAG